MTTWLIAALAVTMAAFVVVFLVVRFVVPLRRPSAAQHERWEKLQSEGKMKFVLKKGVLQWGGFMFVVMTATDLLQQPPYPIDYAFEILKGLFVWSLGGYCFGLAMWAFYKRRFSGESR